MQVLRGSKVEQQCVKGAGKRRDGSGNGECRPDIALNADTEKFDAASVLADRNPGMAKRRLQDSPHDDDCDCEAEQDKIVEVVLCKTINPRAKMNILPTEAGEPVFAASHLIPAHRNEIKQLSDRDSDHRKINS